MIKANELMVKIDPLCSKRVNKCPVCREYPVTRIDTRGVVLACSCSTDGGYTLKDAIGQWNHYSQLRNPKTLKWPEPFIPSKHDEYIYINLDGSVGAYCYLGTVFADCANVKLGNCFFPEDEDKLMAIPVEQRVAKAKELLGEI